MMSQGVRPTAVLADDHPAILARINEILRKDYEILAAVGDAERLIDAVNTLRPNLVVLDIAMRGMSGLEAAQCLKRSGIHAGIVFLTVMEDADYARAARQLGASYVVKRRMHLDLPVAVRETLAGRLFPSSDSAE